MKGHLCLRIIGLLTVILIFPRTTKPQSLFNSTTYTFSVSTGATLENMSVSTIIAQNPLDGSPTALADFGNGFVFNFAGIDYTNFSACADGWVRLGAQGSSQLQSNLASFQNVPFIAPYLEDFFFNNGGTLRIKMIGTAPTRKFVIQWVGWSFANAVVNVTFQLWLWEGSNKMEFVYGAQPVNATNYSIGFTANIGGINSLVSVTTASVITSSTVNYTTANNLNSLAIPAGTKFTFTPDTVAPLAPVNFLFSPVHAGCLTLNWIDSSHNEAFFQVFRSNDSINYNLLKVVPSTTVITSGTSYSFEDTGLINSTTYHYKIAANSIIKPSLSVLSSQTTLPREAIGVKKIPGDYGSVSQAFQSLACEHNNGNLILELQNSYNSGLETFPINIRNTYYTDSIHTITIRPAADAPNLIISSNLTTTINLDSCKYIKLDGRPGGTDTINLLTIENSSSSGGTIKLSRDALHNSISYCHIKGATTSTTSGVICFTNPGQHGNDYNIIDHCDIYDGITTPRYLIASFGTSFVSNDSIAVRNCSLYNHLSAGQTSAIYLGTGNSGWTISNNHFFQTATRSVSGIYSEIYIQDTKNVGNFTISGNTIGGSNAQMSGSPLQLTGSTSNPVYFIYMRVKEVPSNFIEGNKFKNIDLTLTWFTNAFIRIDSGWVNIGDQQGNTIGTQDTTHTIVLHNTIFHVIDAFNRSTINISNNSIGGILMTGGSVGDLIGINLYNMDSAYIYNNIFGSETASNSILSTNYSTINGVYFYNPGGHILIDHNKFMNLANTLSTSTYNTSISGIGGTSMPSNYDAFHTTITNNKIINLVNHFNIPTYNSQNTLTMTGISVYSISHNSNVISNNEVANLENISTGFNVQIDGIHLSSDYTAPFTIENNFIHHIYLTASGTECTVDGFFLNSGLFNLDNNIVALGMDANGVSVPFTFWNGILATGDAMINGYYNTFFIGGTAADNNHPTMVMELEVYAHCKFYDNIFCDMRTWNSKAGGMIFINNSKNNFEASNNLYFTVPGKVYYAADSTSIRVDPLLINPLGSMSTIDMHVALNSPCESTGKYFSTFPYDFDGQRRCDYTPADIGADAINYNVPLQVSPSSVSICQGSSTKLIAGGVLNYSWQPSSGLNSTSNDTVSATPDSSVVYFVTGNSSNGCSYTDSASVNVIPNPNISIAANDTTSFCKGGSVTLAATFSGLPALQWYKNSSIIQNQTDSTLKVKATGNYYCIASGICPDTSNTISVSALAVPNVTITASGPLTFCEGDSVILSIPHQAGTSYQWNRNSLPITGATTYTYTVFDAGNYQVVATKNNDECSKTSKKLKVKVPCRNNQENNQELTPAVYPNPSSGDAYLIGLGNNSYDVSIFSVQGDLLQQYRNITDGTEIGSELPKGSFVIKLSNDKSVIVLKIVKI